MRETAPRPTRRTGGLVVKTMGPELLVYDLEQHRAHSLNPVATAVWRAVDGTREVPAVATAVAADVGERVSEDVVRYAIQLLGRARLLTAPVEATELTRRDLIRRLGTAAAVALPLVTTLVAPTASQAQSCMGDFQSGCTSGAQCCSGCCCSTAAGTCTPPSDCPFTCL